VVMITIGKFWPKKVVLHLPINVVIIVIR